MKKKVCKRCKLFVDGGECPYCKENQFTTSWNGRITFLDVSKSMIAQKMGVDKEGEFALKVR